MKKSNKILLIVIVCIFAIILMIGVIFRIAMTYTTHAPHCRIASCNVFNEPAGNDLKQIASIKIAN